MTMLFTFLAAFTKRKYKDAAKNKVTKEVKDSALLGERTLPKKTTARNKRIGRSKGVLLILTVLSKTVFRPKRRKHSRETPIRRICFGIIKASVVMVVKRRGYATKNRLSKPSEKYSR